MVETNYPSTGRRAEAASEHVKPEWFCPRQAIEFDDYLAGLLGRLGDRVNDLACGGAVQLPMQPKQVPRPGEARTKPEAPNHHH